MEIFKLLGTIAIDGADEAKKETTSVAEHAKEKGSALLKSVAKIGAAAVAAASAAVVALGKQALTAYADYEQLVGGVDTLFKESSDMVQEYAANAYKTAGLSANEYMETVTSFSASLLQSLSNDTTAAAEMANIAITDMSDNANKMGTDMASIQNAYQGFAKQNYTMLDNLKLGYGGTKTEMERLIDDANALNAAQGKYTEYTIDSYADIISAIHDIQVEMEISGISAEEAAEAVASGAMTQEEAFAAMGTTAKEASTTIQGSVNSMKGAWKNLLVGIADENADFKGLMSNFVDSLVTVGENIIPRIKIIIQGITQLISSASQTIIPMAVQTILENLPDIVSAGVDMVVALVSGIVDNADLLIDCVLDLIDTLSGKLIDGGAQIVVSLANGIMEAIPKLANAAIDLMSKLGEYLRENLPTIMQTGLEAILQFTASLRENAGKVVVGALALAKNLAQGLADSIPAIVENVPTIVSNIANVINDNAPKVLAAAVNIVVTLVKGLISAIPTIVKNMPKIISAIWDTLAAINWANLGKTLIQGIGSGIKAMGSFAKNSMETIKTAIMNGIKSLPTALKNIGKNMVTGLWNGIVSMKDWLLSLVKNFLNNIVNSIKKVLGIASPSKVFAGIGGFMAEGLGEGFDDQFKTVKEDIENNMNFDDANASINVSGNVQKQVANAATATQNTQGSNDKSINLTVVSPDGKELARFIAPYMGAQLQLVRG